MSSESNCPVLGKNQSRNLFDSFIQCRLRLRVPPLIYLPMGEGSDGFLIQ